MKVPYYDNKQSNEIFENFKAGDKIHLIESNWGRWSVRTFTVMKRTPKGALRLSNGELLKYLSRGYKPDTPEVNEAIRQIKAYKEFEELISIMYHKATQDINELPIDKVEECIALIKEHLI